MQALPKGRLLLALSLAADARHAATAGSRSSSPLKKKMGTVKAALAASRALVEASSTTPGDTATIREDGGGASGELPSTPGEASSSSSKETRPSSLSSSSSASKLPQLVKRMSLRPAQESTHLVASSVLATFTRQGNRLEIEADDKAEGQKKSISSPQNPGENSKSPVSVRKSPKTPKLSSSAGGDAEDPFADFYGGASVLGVGGPAYVMRCATKTSFCSFFLKCTPSLFLVFI